MRVLDEAPEDWGHRRRLVERLLEDGHQGEALQILAEAPSVPEDENEELFFCEQLLEEAPADVLPFLYRTLMRNPSSASAEALREKATRLMAVKPDLMLARESSGYAHAAPPSQANPRLITPQLTRTAPVVTPPPAASLSSTQIANRVAQSQRLAKKKNRTLAVLIAGVIHALIILLCIFWILKPSALSEPMVILGVPPAEEIQDQVTKRTIAQVLPQRPSASSASRMPVIAANALSSISVPQIEIEEVTEDIVGAGDSFGRPRLMVAPGRARCTMATSSDASW